MPKVSVIIPVYNTEKYLRQCLDSVINQTLEDIEIICIDDGSPDNCGQIIDEYTSKDPRIIAIHKINGGYADAINKGLDIAQGEFISIVESDDFCENNMLEEMLNNITQNDSDIVMIDFYRLDEQTNYTTTSNLSKNITPADFNNFNLKIVPSILKNVAFPWKQLYRKTFLDKYNIRMLQDGNGAYEDTPWNIEILTSAEKISYINKPLYYYRINTGTSSCSNGKRTIINYLTRREQARKILINKGIFSNNILEYFYISALTGCLTFYRKISNDYKEEYYNKMRDFLSLSKNDGLTYKFFDKDNKKLFRAILKYDYKHYQKWINIEKLKNMLFSIKKRNKHTIITLLGIKLSINY